MKELKKSETKSDLTREIIILTSKINTKSRLLGTAQTILIFALIFLTSIFYKEISIIANSSLKTTTKAFIICCICSQTILFMSIYFKIWNSSQESETEANKLKAIEKIAEKFIVFNFNLVENFLLPVKSLMYLIYINNMDSQVSKTTVELARSGTLVSLMVIDLASTIYLSYAKVTWMRELNPRSGSFFGKIKGKFEEILIFVVAILPILNSAETRYHSVLFFGLEICLIIFVMFQYFKELPYFNKYTETLVAHFLVLTLMFTIIFKLLNSEFNEALKVFTFLAPFLVSLVSIYLRRVYEDFDLLDPKSSINIGLKKILTIDFKWSDLETQSLLTHINEERGLKAKGGNDRRNQKLPDVMDLDFYMIKRFMKKEKGNYSLLINLIWFLKYDFCMQRVSSVRDKMLNNSKDFTSKVLYQYGKDQITKRLKDHYKRENLADRKSVV